jgi:hypothetical protein
MFKKIKPKSILIKINFKYSKKIEEKIKQDFPQHIRPNTEEKVSLKTVDVKNKNNFKSQQI